MESVIEMSTTDVNKKGSSGINVPAKSTTLTDSQVVQELASSLLTKFNNGSPTISVAGFPIFNVTTFVNNWLAGTTPAVITGALNDAETILAKRQKS